MRAALRPTVAWRPDLLLTSRAGSGPGEVPVLDVTGGGGISGLTRLGYRDDPECPSLGDGVMDCLFVMATDMTAKCGLCDFNQRAW